MIKTAPISGKLASLESDQPPNTLELSFMIHSIKGSQFSSQSACVSVNGHSFILSPRDCKFCERIYERGFSLYIPSNEYVRFSVGIVTLQENSINKQNQINHTGYLHAFAQCKFAPVKKPAVKKLTMETFGGSYVITATLFMGLSSRCRNPIPSKNPQPYQKNQDDSTSQNHQKQRSQTQFAQYRLFEPKPSNKTDDKIEQTPPPVQEKPPGQETPFLTDKVNEVFEAVGADKKDVSDF